MPYQGINREIVWPPHGRSRSRSDLRGRRASRPDRHLWSGAPRLSSTTVWGGSVKLIPGWQAARRLPGAAARPRGSRMRRGVPRASRMAGDIHRVSAVAAWAGQASPPGSRKDSGSIPASMNPMAIAPKRMKLSRDGKVARLIQPRHTDSP